MRMCDACQYHTERSNVVTLLVCNCVPIRHAPTLCVGHCVCHCDCVCVMTIDILIAIVCNDCECRDGYLRMS